MLKIAAIIVGILYILAGYQLITGKNCEHYTTKDIDVGTFAVCVGCTILIIVILSFI